MRKSCTVVLVLPVVTLLLPAAAPAAAADNAARPPAIHRMTDAGTGAEIRVQQRDRLVSIEVEHPTVLIRKQLVDGKTVTTIRSGQEQVVLAFDRDAFTVTGASRRVEVSRAHPERMAQARTILASSPAAARAAALIGRLSFTTDSPLKHTLLTTRGMLLSSMGDETGSAALARTIRGLDPARSGARYARVSYEEQTNGPGVCWTMYAVEAIAAYIEYEGCVNGEEWYDLIGMISCAAIYDLRAIGAFVWWLSCVGVNVG